MADRQQPVQVRDRDVGRKRAVSHPAFLPVPGGPPGVLVIRLPPAEKDLFPRKGTYLPASPGHLGDQRGPSFSTQDAPLGPPLPPATAPVRLEIAHGKEQLGVVIVVEAVHAGSCVSVTTIVWAPPLPGTLIVTLAAL